MADGSITFNTSLDNKQLERELSKLKKDIAKLEESTAGQESKKSPLVQQAHELEQKMKTARAEVERYRSAWTSGVSGADKDQSAAVVKAQQLEAAHAGVVAQIDKIDTKLQPAYTTMDAMKIKAGDVAKELSKAGVFGGRMGTAIEHAGKSLDRFKMRLKEVVRSALIFTLITQSLAKFRNWMGKVVQSNTEASAAVGRLKGALLTLAQPLVNILVPAFTMLVNVVTRVVSTLAQLFAMLTGSTISGSKDAAKALNEETAALEGAGAAAKDASKSMAGFDEINKLSDGTGSGGNGGGGSTTAPNFDFEANLSEGQLKNILGLVEAVGTAFLAWRIGNALGLNLKQTLGLALAIYSAIQFVKNVFDAWTNGVNMDNLIGMLAGAAGVAVGLGIALGPVAAGISLVVTGLVMLVTGFRDAATNGWNFENLLLSIAGIMATGIGIALLTGSFIPALIAAIASVVLAITVAFGHGDELISGAKQILQGFIDFFVGIFTGDIDRAVKGIGGIFGGLKTMLGAILDSLSDMFNSFFDWLDEKTGGKMKGTIELLRGLITGFIGWVKSTLGSIIDAVQQMFEGLVIFFSGVFTGDWDKAWSRIVEIGKGAINLLIGLIEGFVNFFVRAINAVIGALNTIRVNVPDILGGGSIGFDLPNVSEIKLPRLATGGVIPPNREFMAVLGDQKRGTNIEAPLSTIKQGVREVMAEGGGGGQPREIILRLVSDRGFVRNLKVELDAESQRSGVTLVRRAT